MIGFEILAGMSALLGGLGVVELARHRKRLEAIPVRVHVNGTRGKSSVTRLIAAGMRSGGVTTCAKTTGTLARMILPDGRELPVFRPAKANVIEQRLPVGVKLHPLLQRGKVPVEWKGVADRQLPELGPYSWARIHRAFGADAA